MKTSRNYLIPVLALLMAALFGSALLAACSPAAAPVVDNTFATHTAAAQMVQATQAALAIQSTQLALEQQAQSLRGTQAALAATSQPAPTNTPEPAFTSTPQPTNTPVNTSVPQPTATSGPCSNGARFLGENWKDDTKILAGQFFVKRWTLENVGTCTWTTDYTITVLPNSTMGIRNSVVRDWRMPKTVKPGETVDILIEMWAPFGAGTFESKFNIVATNGAKFGVGANGGVPIYARLLVVDTPIPQKEADLSFGQPGWNYTFDEEPWRWALIGASDSKVEYSIKDSHMIMLAKTAPYTRWIIGTQSPAYSQMVQATFTTGPACSDKDSYGLALRAEKTSPGIYNRAYVFKFSCDGQYRVYYLNESSVTEIAPWTASAQIKTGPNQANRMGVLILGGKIVLYANGEKVIEIKNQVPGDAAGIYGLAITADKTDNLVVYVDDYKLWRLDEWLK